MTTSCERSYLTLVSASWRCVSAVAFAAAVFCMPLAAHAAVDVGHTNLVKNSVFGTFKGQPRHLMLKDRVYFEEEIVTGIESATQITFADDTKLTMGPNARMVLDEMVYDPRDPTISKMSMTMVQGVFSFVSGRMESAAYTIKTPTTTIGVRGTAFSVLVRPNGTSAVTLNKGIVRVNAGGRTIGLMEPGKATVVRAAPPGAPPPPPSAPAPPPADMAVEMQQMNMLVASAANEAGVEVEVLDVPTEVSAPLGPENAPPEAPDGAPTDAQAAPVGGEPSIEEVATAPGGEPAEPVDVDTGGEAVAPTVAVGPLPIDEVNNEIEVTLNPPPAYVPTELSTYSIAVTEDGTAILKVYVNEDTGEVYGHYDGKIDSVQSIGVLTGTVTGTTVTATLHAQPNSRDGSANSAYYYTAEAFTFELDGTGTAVSLTKYTDALAANGTTTLNWTATLDGTTTVSASGAELGPAGAATLTAHISALGVKNDQTSGTLTEYIGVTLDPDTGTGFSTTDAATFATVIPGDKMGGAVSSTSKAFFGVSPESEAADYTHMAWGHWGEVNSSFSGGTFQNINAASSYWIAGERTPATLDFSTLGLTTATYTGQMAGAYLPDATGSDASVLRGTFSMTADMNAKTFTGSFDLNNKTTSAAFVTGGGLSGSWDGAGNLNGSMTGSTADGGSLASGGGGFVHGTFYGATAEEVGGMWHFDVTDGTVPGDAAGIFAGKR